MENQSTGNEIFENSRSEELQNSTNNSRSPDFDNHRPSLNSEALIDITDFKFEVDDTDSGIVELKSPSVPNDPKVREEASKTPQKDVSNNKRTPGEVFEVYDCPLCEKKYISRLHAKMHILDNHNSTQIKAEKLCLLIEPRIV